MGCLDEIKTLKFDEVFVEISHTPGNKQFHDTGLSGFAQNPLDSKIRIVQGKVIVAKNPCLHPGDVRVLSAMNTHKIHHMIDCIVFPHKVKDPNQMGVLGVIQMDAIKSYSALLNCYMGVELDAIKSVADAYLKRSLKDFEYALKENRFTWMEEFPILRPELEKLSFTKGTIPL